MTSLQTLRIPKGLWADLEETVIQQDRQFLTEVARSLGLSVPDVLRKCLGTGAPQPVAVLLGSPAEDLAICPWWTKSEEGCWKPCCRLRLTPTTACQLHTIPGLNSCLSTDKRLAKLPQLQPVQYEGSIYWVAGDIVYREDGTRETDIEFKFIDHAGQRICISRKA